MSGLMIGAAALLAPSVMAIGLGLGPEPGRRRCRQAISPRGPGRRARRCGPGVGAAAGGGLPPGAGADRAGGGERRTGWPPSARTPGSIAFLQARIDRAESSGQADTARLLGNRLAIRRDIAGPPAGRAARLQDSEAGVRRPPAVGAGSTPPGAGHERVRSRGCRGLGVGVVLMAGAERLRAAAAGGPAVRGRGWSRASRRCCARRTPSWPRSRRSRGRTGEEQPGRRAGSSGTAPSGACPALAGRRGTVDSSLRVAGRSAPTLRRR